MNYSTNPVADQVRNQQCMDDTEQNRMELSKAWKFEIADTFRSMEQGAVDRLTLPYVSYSKQRIDRQPMAEVVEDMLGHPEVMQALLKLLATSAAKDLREVMADRYAYTWLDDMVEYSL